MKIQGLVASVLLAVAGVLPAQANAPVGVPTLESEKFCASTAERLKGGDEHKAACLNTEAKAQEELATVWVETEPGVQSYCESLVRQSGEVTGDGSAYTVLLACAKAETKAKAEILEAWAGRNAICAAIVETRQIPAYSLLNLCVNPK